MHSSKAIVLSRDPFGEADLYVQFLTRDWGVMTLLAKSARKSKRRYVGGLDIFCHDEIYVRGLPNRPYLSELTVLNAFTGLRDHLDRMFTAGKAVSWVKRLSDPMTPVPGIYSLLGQTLSLIERETRPERLEFLEAVFKLKLLSQLGLKPRTDACARCDGEEITGSVFDVAAGGLLCRACLGHGSSERLSLAPEIVDFLGQADETRLTGWESFRTGESRARELNRMLTQFASYHTHVVL